MKFFYRLFYLRNKEYSRELGETFTLTYNTTSFPSNRYDVLAASQCLPSPPSGIVLEPKDKKWSSINHLTSNQFFFCIYFCIYLIPSSSGVKTIQNVENSFIIYTVYFHFLFLFSQSFDLLSMTELNFFFMIGS